MENFGINQLLIPLIVILIALLLVKPLTNIPISIASKWRLKASNQMVLCILYIVMYMRHTSNLEHAIKFAADHIGNPLALDLRKVFWDVETGKFSTMKESLDNYLKTWRKYNLEFVESFHLIQGSLYEQTEDRRITMLEKALDVILNGTYDNMMHYTHELKNPITMLHMLGVVLPILGLVILPLMGSLMGGSATNKIIFLFIIYNITLPIVVYLIGTNILSKRPTGYSEGNLIEQNPELAKYKNIIFRIGNREFTFDPFYISFFIFVVIACIGVLPLIMYSIGVDFPFLGETLFLDYKQGNGLQCKLNQGCYGPFGAGAVLLSLFFPLGLALGLGTYYRLRTKKLIKIKEETKKLELEFAGSLFQLGNRIGDGIPVELAFGDVAENMEGTPTGDFFQTVSNNIKQFGISVKSAIFDSKLGAIWKYPSNLIESSMKILIESAKKGPLITSKSLTSISLYVDKIHKINERLKDLLSDIISSMKSQISFLTPIISGIVVGISTMIVVILSRLSTLMTQSSSSGDAGATEMSFGGLEGLTGLFDIVNIIPGYYLQLIIGIYVVEIIVILSLLVNSIEYGPDKISGQYYASKNLYTSVFLYFIVALIVTLIFTAMAAGIQLTNV
ncbi:MAG: hypothetical protein ISS82_02845 [Nanoarchaeota archaeon]|nr:hypothetical protein [Nanoarchaeota archaeon]